MKTLYTLLFLFSFILPVVAEEKDLEKEIKIIGKAHHWLIGKWSGSSTATDPKIHLYFEIDNKGKIEHLFYTGWDHEEKVLLGSFSGVVDFKEFDKNRSVTLKSKCGTTLTFKVKFVKGGARFIQEETLYEHILLKRALK